MKSSKWYVEKVIWWKIILDDSVGYIYINKYMHVCIMYYAKALKSYSLIGTKIVLVFNVQEILLWEVDKRNTMDAKAGAYASGA